MADEISQVVEVYISRETAQIDTASFDIPLLMINLPDTIDNSDPMSPVTVPADVTNRVTVHTSVTSVEDTYGSESTAAAMARKLMGAGTTRPSQFMVGVKNSTETYTQGLAAIMEYNNDWYMIAIDSKQDADIKAVAESIQAQRKMFLTSSSSTAILAPLNTTDIASWLRDGNYDRVALVYSPTAETDHPEVVWMGSQITAVPGSNTWNFKAGAGAQIARLSATDISTLDAKNVNYFRRLGGVNMFQTGTTSQGEWIDTIIGLDWVQARIQEQVFYRLATKKKVPMTAAGAAIIGAEIRSVLSQGVQNGLIAEAPAYQVREPEVLLIPEVQRAQRIMGDFTFSFRLAGAVHKVIVRGTVSA